MRYPELSHLSGETLRQREAEIAEMEEKGWKVVHVGKIRTLFKNDHGGKAVFVHEDPQ